MSSRSSYGRLNKRVKVTHRMTPYDVVVRSVILSDETGSGAPVIDAESRNILEGEVLMEKDTDRSLYLSNHRHVHSDQRAWQFDGPGELESKVANLRYAGISVTGFDARSGQYQQGFMSTIGGLNSIMNTGDRALVAGKEVYAVPTSSAAPEHKTNIIGVPRSKKLFATVHEDSPLFIAAATAAIGNGRPDEADAQAEWDRRAVQKLRKFCIGTCLRGGRRNQLVDVVLHSSANVIHVG